jgi:hypothetical protein
MGGESLCEKYLETKNPMSYRTSELNEKERATLQYGVIVSVSRRRLPVVPVRQETNLLSSENG